MSTNTNVFPKNVTVNGVTTVYGEKFVDFDGLSYFWSKAKSYVDAADEVLSGRIDALANTVGDDTKGLIKDFNDLKAYTESLGDIEGGEGLGGMIDSKIAALDLPNTYEAKGAAETALESANGYTDSAVAGLKSDLEGQLGNAVDSVAGSIDTKISSALGVASSEGVEATGLRKEIEDRDAQVLSDAKAYVDTVLDGDNGLVTRVEKLEAIDHDKLAEEAAKTAVAAVVDGAPESFDTLKEIVEWIGANEENKDGFDVASRIIALEAADTTIREEFAAADENVLAAAKKYADDQDAVLAETVAKNLADAVGVASSEGVEATGLRAEIEAAKAAAIADAAAKDAVVSGRIDTLAETVAQNFADAKTYAEGKAADAEANAKGYVDTKLADYTNTTSMEAAIAAAKEAAIKAAQDKIDELAAQVANKADKSYVDDEIAGAKAYATTYTDELFNSIEFISESDIDQMFADAE